MDLFKVAISLEFVSISKTIGMPTHAMSITHLNAAPCSLKSISSQFRTNGGCRNASFGSQRTLLQCQRPLPTFAAACSPPTAENDAAAAPGIEQDSPLSRIPPEKLKSLRRLGLEMQDVIKLGRLGVGQGVKQQIHNRWKTSEVAKLYCGGKPGVNMKAMAEALERETGGIVVHRSGGSVFLYRGDGDVEINSLDT